MDLGFTLALPRDALSVPVVRRVLVGALTALGAQPDGVHDVQIALAEACTNVLDHATASDDYHVSIRVSDHVCVLEVVDAGRGFRADALGHDQADTEAERGRGLQLIRALVDHVAFTSRPQRGTLVYLEKRLDWLPDSPVRRLIAASPASAAMTD